MSDIEINIGKHKLVPKHEIADKRETAKLLEEYHITVEKLPRIIASDPMVKGIGAKPGDIVKITRDSETAGTVFYYRYVVEE